MSLVRGNGHVKDPVIAIPELLYPEANVVALSGGDEAKVFTINTACRVSISG